MENKNQETGDEMARIRRETQVSQPAHAEIRLIQLFIPLLLPLLCTAESEARIRQ